MPPAASSIRCRPRRAPTASSALLLLTTTTLLLQACPGASQFNTECGVGETQLVLKVGGTDRLSSSKCSDYFDDVDPYAIVTVGADRLGVSKTTGRLDNTAVPTWNALLDFGCVEEDSRISFRVKDWDFFDDETCLGPVSIIDDWPPSGQPALICEHVVINGMGTGCISFALFYGADAANAASSGLAIPPVPGTMPTASSDASPFMTPQTPPTTSTGSGRPVVGAPGVPTSGQRPLSPATTPSAPSPSPLNATRPRPSQQQPSVPPPPQPPQPQPRVSEGPTTPTIGSGNGSSYNGTLPKRPVTPPVVQAPSPRAQEQPEAEKAKAKSAQRNKGAAVAGGIVLTLALVGAAVGIYATRRWRRQEGHAQGLDLEDARSGRAMGEAPGSVAVL